MPFYHCYRPKRFRGRSAEMIEQANRIITEMTKQGYVLSLRQLFYQFVKANLIANTHAEYKRLQRTITAAREAGVMDWMAIEDRGRGPSKPYSQEDPAALLKNISSGLCLNMWARQDYYLEVYVEKDALEGVIARPCSKYHVVHMACKGYLSASEAWRAGLRFQQALDAGKRCVLIHLGDHDPSGLHMTEDNRERLHLFAENDRIEIRRIALNMDQVERYKPPPNYAKQTDSRWKAYAAKHGEYSWELDALDPETLDQLVSSTILEYRDKDKWQEALDEQEELRRTSGLQGLETHWPQVQAYLHHMGWA